MIISIKVKTRSPKSLVEKTQGGDYLVFVKEITEKGKANKEIIKLLAKYFNVVQSRIVIKSGVGGTKKIIEVLE